MERVRLGKLVTRREILKSAVVAAGAAMVPILAACGPSAPAAQPAPTAAPAAPAAAPKTQAPAATTERELLLLQGVHFVPPADEERLRQIAEFTKETGVKVKTEAIAGSQLQMRTATAVQTKSGPDVIQIEMNWPWLYENSMVDVSDVATEVDKAVGGFYPDIAQFANVKGTWRAVPLYYWSGTFAYRKKWFQEAGVTKLPTTWDEFMDAGKKLKKYGKPFGQAFGHSNVDPYYFSYPWMWAHGGKEVEQDGKTVAINSKETLTAVEKVVELAKEVWVPGVLSWDDSSNNRAFLAGQVSCTLNAASIYFVAKRDVPDIAEDIDHFGWPSGPAGKVAYNAVAHFAIMGYSKNADAAKQLVRHFMKIENVKKWLDIQQGFGQGPGPETDKIDTWTKGDPKVKPFLEVITSKIGRHPGYAGPPSAAASEALVRFIVLDMFAKAMSGEFKPDEAVKWAEAQLKGIYK